MSNDPVFYATRDRLIEFPAHRPAAAVLEALSIGSLPDVVWQHGDDLCDCIFQRIGMWKNPYLAETLEIRLCCIWAKIAEQYPEFVRTIPGYFDDNTDTWFTEPMAWDAEHDMPKAIWYRHLARTLNRPLAEIRAEYADKDDLRPKGTPIEHAPRRGRSRWRLFSRR